MGCKLTLQAMLFPKIVVSKTSHRNYDSNYYLLENQHWEDDYLCCLDSSLPVSVSIISEIWSLSWYIFFVIRFENDEILLLCYSPRSKSSRNIVNVNNKSHK